MTKLSEAERDDGAGGAARLDLRRRRATRSAELPLRDFGEAFAFMTRVALAAEKADHHPDWSNSWNQVEIPLTTHSAGGVTAKDVALARTIDAIEGAAP